MGKRQFKPCPFCGEVSGIKIVPDDEEYEEMFVERPTCGATGPRFPVLDCRSHKEGIKFMDSIAAAWNTLVPRD